MYLPHLLELLSILLVVNAGSRRQSRKHKERRLSTTPEPDYYDEEEDYDYHHNIQRDKGRLEQGNPYLMYHDSQQLPHRNKLLIIVVGG